MNKKENILYMLYFILFIFLLLWIYLSEAEFKTNSFEIVGFQQNEYLINTKQTITEIKTIYEPEELVVEKIIGQKEVKTGIYKKTKYLGRYVYLDKQTNKDHVYIDQYVANICEDVCKKAVMYVYDKYEVIELTEIIDIKINTVLIVQKEMEVKEQKEIEVLKTVTRVSPIFDRKENNDKINFLSSNLFLYNK